MYTLHYRLIATLIVSLVLHSLNNGFSMYLMIVATLIRGSFGAIPSLCFYLAVVLKSSGGRL